MSVLSFKLGGSFLHLGTSLAVLPLHVQIPFNGRSDVQKWLGLGLDLGRVRLRIRVMARVRVKFLLTRLTSCVYAFVSGGEGNTCYHLSNMWRCVRVDL